MTDDPRVKFGIQLRDGESYWLWLTPDNYQHEFQEFINGVDISLNEAVQLKQKIQIALMERLVEIGKNRLEGRMKEEREEEQWRNWEGLKEADELQPPSHLEKRRALGIEEASQTSFGVEEGSQTKRSLVVEEACQTIDFCQDSHLTGTEDNRLRGTHSTLQTWNRREPEGVDLWKNRGVVERHSLSEEQKDQKEVNQVNDEDILPRAVDPNIHMVTNQHPCFPFVAPQDSLEIPKRSPIMNLHSIESHKQPSLPLPKSNNKPLLLQFLTKKKTPTPPNPNPPKLLPPNPQIFTRLSQTQTVSSHNKHIQEINSQQQEIFKQMIQYKQKQKNMQRIHQQDMSTKTTISFMAKRENEPNRTQEKEEKEYQKAFQEHLRKKEEQAKRKQGSHPKQQEKKAHKSPYPYCQAIAMQESMDTEKQERKKKQHKIRQRIKLNKTNYHESPKTVSRGCPSCSPSPSPDQESPPTSRGKKSARKRVDDLNDRYPHNRDYVSNILGTSYNQFIHQIPRTN